MARIPVFRYLGGFAGWARVLSQYTMCEPVHYVCTYLLMLEASTYAHTG